MSGETSVLLLSSPPSIMSGETSLLLLSSPPSIMSGETSLLLLWLVLIQEGASIRPVVTFTPNYKKIFTSEKMTMTCDVGSTIGEGMDYIWYKDNYPVHNGKSYTIQDAGTSDSGSYQCQTRSGEISDPVTLGVIYDYVILQTPLYVYEGDLLTLRCRHYPGYKGGRTIFFKDNRVIRDWGDYAEYHIGEVDRTTVGTYKCRKEVDDVKLNQIYEDRVFVSVEGLELLEEGAAIRPVVTFTPNYKKIFTSEMMIMTCDAGSTKREGMDYIWYKFNYPIQNGKSYIIQDARTSDSGSYRCQTRPGEISDPVTLGVSVDYVILQTPLYVYEGDDINIRCRHRPGYEGTETIFYKDNEVIRGPGDDAEYNISHVTRTTAGTYGCRKYIYYNGLNRIHRDEASVSLEGSTIRPVVTFTPNYKKIFTAEKMTMTCDVGSTIGEGMDYIWYKDNSPVHNGKSYTIQDAETSHSGSYQCQTRPGEISDPVTLDVHFNMIFTTPTMKVIPGRVSLDDNMTLTCETRLHPSKKNTRLQFAFYKDGQTVREFGFSRNYKVYSVQMKDYGKYFCLISTSGNRIMKRSAENFIQAEGFIGHMGYTRLNIIRLILSGSVIITGALFVFYHIKWMKSMEEAAAPSTT
ncbi:Fc receptor-like protein 5 isoform X3 [Engystomops pustulosus]|uniref:Fc receptor-like protein 5 isoform X3 n=1 Tax=Engystomops pustulosus TaxID=76066 RepID=UPI003AFB5CCF